MGLLRELPQTMPFTWKVRQWPGRGPEVPHFKTQMLSSGGASLVRIRLNNPLPMIGI